MLQYGALAEDINLASNVHVPAADNSSLVLLLARVDFLDIVFGVLDDDFVRLIVQSVDDADLVSLFVLHPPRFKANELDVVFKNIND